MNFLGSDGKNDDTPFDGSGLLDKSIKTRRQLYKVEFDCIHQVTIKYLSSKPSKRLAPFNYQWFLTLHKEMLGDVWSWAGNVRQSDKTLGVSRDMISSHLGQLAMEADKRRGEPSSLVVSTAAEFHHLAVKAHPFEDGNGRWSRMLANIWQVQHGQPPTIWPDEDLRDATSPIRGEYISAIKDADFRNYEPLIQLHLRYLDSE